MARQLRERNKVGAGAKRASGENDGADSAYGLRDIQIEARSFSGFPLIPDPHEGFGSFDFAQAETRDTQLYYDTQRIHWKTIRMQAVKNVATCATTLRPRNGMYLVIGHWCASFPKV